jgi:hypothetical protein
MNRIDSVLKQYLLCIVALLAAGACGVHAQQQRESRAPEPELDIAALIQQSDLNGRRWIFNYPNYTYKRRQTLRRRNRSGKIKETSEVSEMIIPDYGYRYKKPMYPFLLIEKDGVPVSPRHLAKERAKLGARLARAERESEAGPTGFFREHERWGLLYACAEGGSCFELAVSDVLKSSDFDSPVRERIGERESLVLHFRPKHGVVVGAPGQLMSRMEGRIWIDLADRVVSRFVAWPGGTSRVDAHGEELFSRVALAFEQVKTREGHWLISRLQVNALNYPELFPGATSEFCTIFFDHAYYKVELQHERLDNPSQP